VLAVEAVNRLVGAEADWGPCSDSSATASAAIATNNHQASKRPSVAIILILAIASDPRVLSLIRPAAIILYGDASL